MSDPIDDPLHGADKGIGPSRGPLPLMLPIRKAEGVPYCQDIQHLHNYILDLETYVNGLYRENQKLTLTIRTVEDVIRNSKA